MANLKRIAPFLLLGPITGPLIAGVVFNFREGRPVLAGLYAVAAVTVTVCLPLITARMGLDVISNGALQQFAAMMGVRTG